jgi:hypothetical protein
MSDIDLESLRDDGPEWIENKGDGNHAALESRGMDLVLRDARAVYGLPYFHEMDGFVHTGDGRDIMAYRPYK